MTVEDEQDWEAWSARWSIRADTIYLNHGSFGPAPDHVRQTQLEWKRRMDEQPMDFFVRQLEPAWLEARRRLAEFVGTAPQNLIFIENATYGMNLVADSLSLAADDEVLLTDHEYGAVVRIWNRACQKRQSKVVRVNLPLPLESAEQVVDTIVASFTERTRVLVVSHVTSPTAIILPIDRIVAEARRRGIIVCVDGPHAPLQVPVNIDSLQCDFYTASCHKWLSAPFGSGFLYVHPRFQETLRPALLSWGRLLPDVPQSWTEEFIWTGTRDPSPYLSIPAALDFAEEVGAATFRERTHRLAQYARRQITDLFDREPIVPDDPQWYGSMAHVPLPPGECRSLQNALWQQFGIEVPIVDWNGGRYIRVSCHLYNCRRHIDQLVGALKKLV